MNRVLLKKNIAEVQLLLFASAALLFAFCWVRIFIVASIDTSSFATIVSKLTTTVGGKPAALVRLLHPFERRQILQQCRVGIVVRPAAQEH